MNLSKLRNQMRQYAFLISFVAVAVSFFIALYTWKGFTSQLTQSAESTNSALNLAIATSINLIGWIIVMAWINAKDDPLYEGRRVYRRVQRTRRKQNRELERQLRNIRTH